jgi:hypothetical protein
MAPRIPNFNTLSTIIDRLSIENVKLADVENALEHDDLSDAQRVAFQKKIAVQRNVIEALRHELAAGLKEIFLKRQYTYFKEERTFT